MEGLYDLNTADVARGAHRKPSAGQYLLSIHSVEVEKTYKGYHRMILSFDIAEGTHKWYYSEQTKAFKKNRYLKHYQLIDEENSQPYFMLMIRCIEASNMGYKFNWNESTLVGKKVGAILRLEEYLDNDGSLRTSLKVFGFLPSNEVDNTQPPPSLKRLPEDNKSTKENINNISFNSFNNESIDTDDLPF